MSGHNNTAISDHKTERMVIGTAISDRDRLAELLEIVEPSDFTLPAAVEIYNIVLELIEKNAPVDPYSVHLNLKEKGLLSKLGGTIAFDLADDRVWVPIKWHCQKLKQMSKMRQLATFSSGIAVSAQSGERGIDELHSYMESELQKIGDLGTEGEIHSMESLLIDFMQTAGDENRLESIIPTPWGGLDRLIEGFRPSMSYVIGGYTGQGKTQLALQIAEAAARKGYASSFLSMEMSGEQLAERVSLVGFNIEKWKVRRKKLSALDWSLITQRVNSWQGLAPVEVLDKSIVTVGQLWSAARRFHRKYGFGLFIVDYIGLIQAPKAERREREVAEISRNLKLISTKYGLAVLTVSQLRRPVAAAKSKKPHLEMLRESGAIGQDTDVLLLPWINKDEKTKGRAQLIVEKNRHGDEGMIRMLFQNGQWRELETEHTNGGRPF